VIRISESGNGYKILEGKPSLKRPLGIPRRYEDNIKMDLSDRGYEYGR
jgi:hypothetical protein